MSFLIDPPGAVTKTFINSGHDHNGNCNPELIPQNNLWAVKNLLPMIFLACTVILKTSDNTFSNKHKVNEIFVHF